MRSCKRMAVMGLAVLFALASLWVPSTTDAGRMFRLSMENGAFTSGEISDSGAGTVFYTKTVTVPVIGDDTATFLFVSVSGSMEGLTLTDRGELGCEVDATPCNPAGVDAFAGFIAIMLDIGLSAPPERGFTYVWCVGPVPSGSHTVDLTLLGSLGAVALDSVQVAIDAARMSQGTCSAESF